MSSFDDLLNFGDSGTTGDQSGDPFGLTGNQSGGGGGSGDLLDLDLGFGAPITTQNGSSGKVNFEANTNPLYELSNNSQPMMEGETSNPLFDLSPEPTKEATKMETSGNPLYDYLQSEATTNGHSNGQDEVVLTNGGGGNAEVDLLGLSGDVGASGALTSDDSGVTLDSNFLSESNTEAESDMKVPEQDLEPEPEPECEMKVPEQDLQPEIEPESEMKVPEQDLQPEVEEEPEPVQEVEPEVEEVTQVSEPEEQKQVSEAAVEQNGTAEPEEIEAAPASVTETQLGEKEEPAEKEEKKAENQEAQNEAAPEEDKVDETPDAVEEVVKADQEPEVEAGKPQEPEAEESKPEAPQEAVIPVAEPQQEPEEPVSSEPEAPAAEEQSKPDTVDESEPAPAEDKIDEAKPAESQPEPAEAEANESAPAPEAADVAESPAEAVQPAPVQEEVQPEVAEQTEAAPEPEKVEEAAPAPAEVEQVSEQAPVEQAEPEQVQQAAPEPEQVEESAPEPTEAEQVEEPASEPAKAEQAVPEPTTEQATPEQAPVEPEQAASEPEAEQAAPEPEQAVPEPAEAEQAAPATTEVEQPAPVEEVHVETTKPVEAEPAVPEVVEQVEDQLPAVEQAVVAEEQKEVEAAPESQPEEQPAEAVVENTTEAGNEDQIVPDSPAVTEAKPDEADSAPAEDGVAKAVNGTNEVKENGVTEEEEAVRDPSIFRETREKEEIHFAELNNFRQKFESGKIDDKEPEQKKTSVKDEYDQGGEFENEPVQNPDVVKETDRPSEPLPEAGTAKNLLDKFKTIQEEKAQTVTSQKRESPPRQDKVEYESTPTDRLVIEEGKSDMGEFESTPQAREDVIRSDDRIEDAVPESGSTKNIMNRFKEIGSGSGESMPRGQRELTPDSSGKVEYVSEPRGQKIQYEETRVEAGVFENTPTNEEDVVRAEDRAQEVMPESGTAKNLLSKFKQMETEVGNRPPPSPKRDMRAITPDKSGKVEYVSEPRGAKIEYEEQKEDQGVFESKPAEPLEVVRSHELVDDVKPEAGSAKKTMERFKELQKQSASPVSSSPRKEFTPPREASPGKTVVGVVENTPEDAKEDVVRSGDRVQDEMPEQGSAKNILNKFKEIQTSAGASPADSPTKKIKEFTPPPESGVYENKPADRLVLEEQKGFEGVLENTPAESQADVARIREPESVEKELPESGTAKNLVSKFRQLESTSAKNSSSSSPHKFKEFTPPRDRGPLSPKSPAGQPSEGVNLSDLPSQYQQQTDKPGVFENEPEVLPDVYREADNDWEKDMPAPNTTMSMLQKFKSIQSQAKEDQKTPAPVSRKDDPQTSPEPEEFQEDNTPQEMETPNDTPYETPNDMEMPNDAEVELSTAGAESSEKAMFKVVQTEKCDACEKTVYAMEKLEMNGHVYHKNCFKCSHCSARLTPKTFSMNEGVIYCVNHFKQLFARKGNYDEGFGRQQYKKKWNDPKKEVATA